MNVLPGKKPNMLVPTMATILPNTVSKACPPNMRGMGRKPLGRKKKKKKEDASQRSTEEGAGAI